MMFITKKTVVYVAVMVAILISYVAQSHGETLNSQQASYILPTPIPATDKQRLAYLATLPEAPTNEQTRASLLIRLTLVVSNKETTVADVDQLEDDMTEWQKNHSNDTEMMAAKGSLIAFKSSLYTDQLSKLSLYSRKGIRLMDRAAKNTPEHLGVRFQRGIANANMPAFTRRAHVAIDDLLLVKQNVGMSYGDGFYQLVNFYLAQAYVRNQEPEKAKPLLSQIATGDSDWSDKSRLALKDL